MKNVLVVGGAGYIGSHTVYDLLQSNYNCIVLDNLKEGHAAAVKGCKLMVADIYDEETVSGVLKENQIDSVIHFAAYTYVGESVVNPAKYYDNNLGATLKLLSAMIKSNVKNIIFSSTCATYGVPVYTPIDEKHPQNPINPYGSTKLMVEKVLEDYHKAYGLNYTALRYFNAAGALPDGSIGESHLQETHLIPLILKTLTGELSTIKVFGTDYDTPDGTCIRDYIHVCDLATAHIKAMERLFDGGSSGFINLGTGTGNSVMEVIRACEKVTGKKVPYTESERRAGDVPQLVAANGMARKELDFTPRYTDIEEIVKTAWRWESNKRY